MVERRVEKVCIGEEETYHLDEVIESETIELVVDEDVTAAVQEQDQPEVWSEAALTRTPPQPSDEVEALAERRLKNMGVIEDLKIEDFYLDKLTTKFVRGRRIKTRTLPDGQQKKQWMRRSRLVAREYAVERRDDVYSPASGSYSLRLLPALLLDMRSRDYQEDETGDPVIGALDIKDAFLQVAQERPLQISTSLGKYKYKVLKNLLGQRIGAIAWYERIRDYLISNQGPKPAYPCGRHHVHRPVKGGGKVCGRFEEGFPGGGHGSKEAWR